MSDVLFQTHRAARGITPGTPTSKIGKFFDFLRRLEYTGAAAAEYLWKDSPYESLASATWAGFTGKRRVDYMDLTGNVPLGIALGFALDPLTYLPFGAIPKMIKATKIPYAIGKAAMATTKIPGVGKHIYTAGTFTRNIIMSGLVDPNWSVKLATPWFKAAKAAKAAGATDDMVRNVQRGALGFGVDDIAKFANVSKGVQIELTKIAELHDVFEMGRKLPHVLKRMHYELRNELKDAYKTYAKLEKTDPKKARAFLDAIELAAPEIKSGKWAMTKEFRSAVGKIIGEDKIAEIVAKHGDDIIPRPMAGMAARVKQTYDSFDDVPAHVRKWFVPEFSEMMDEATKRLGPFADTLLKKHMAIQTELVQEAVNRQVYTAKLLEKFSKDLRMSHVPHMKNPAVTLDQYQRFILRKRQTFYEQIMVDLDELVKKGELVVPKGDKAFLANKATALAKTEIDKLIDGDEIASFIGEVRQIVGKNPQAQRVLNSFARKYKDLSEMRRYSGTLHEINEIVGAKLFETNFAGLLYGQQMRLTAAFLHQDYLQKLMAVSGGAIKHVGAANAKDLPARAAGMSRITNKLLGVYDVDKRIAKAVERVIQLQTGTSKEFNQFIRAFDKVQGFWKYWTLIPFSKFHLRNLVSEMTLSYIGGQSLLSPYHIKALKLVRDARKYKNPKALKLYMEMMDEGVTGAGFFASELGIGAALGRKGVKRVWGLGHVMTGMEEIGVWVEDIPRVSMYLWAQAKGAKWLAKRGFKSPADMVRKFHPYYGNFTGFERAVMRRAFPFYSWPRFNLPLHVEMFVQAPKKYAQLERFRQGVTKQLGGEMPKYYDPEYIKEGYVVGIGKRGKNKGRGYFVLKGWLPHAEIGDIMTFEGWKDRFNQLLTPFVKTPWELAAGKDLFTGKAIPAYPGEKVEIFRLGRIPAKAYHLLRPIRLINDTNRWLFGRKHPYWERVMYALVGRAYTVNDAAAKRQLKREMQTMVYGDRGRGGLTEGVRNAKRNGDHGLARQLQTKIDQLKREMSKL